jgi:hypothetical protein
MSKCFCKDVDFGSYDHQVSMKCPLIERNDGWVCIDVCIATEIAELWHKGIKTLNSCCGHQKLQPTVIVDEKDEPKMIELGYKSEKAQSGLNMWLLTEAEQSIK